MTTSIGFQFASDLHVEFPDVLNANHFPSLVPNAPYLALCGDIGNPTKTPTYEKLIEILAPRFKVIFIVTGNHEYFHSTHEGTHKKIQEITKKYDNVFWLENEGKTIEGIRVVGCCLWTNVEKKWEKQVEGHMNEYDMVNVEEGGKQRKLRVPDTVKWHKESVKFLEKEIKECKKSSTPLLVLTHHCPTHKMSGTGAGYSSSLDHLFGWPVVGWCYGHTHCAEVQYFNGTCVATNPLGYLNLEPQNVNNFRRSSVIWIEKRKGKKGERVAKVVGGETEGEKKEKEEKEELRKFREAMGPPKPIPAPPPPPPM